MKKYLFIIFVIKGLNSFATTTYSVGASRTYSTIADAYAACTASDDYVIEIYNDYSYVGETGGTATISLVALANKSSVNTVTIRPASGHSIAITSTASAIFYLNGANWVIFDGRAGGIGASACTLVNSNTASSKRIFTFINDASNNVVKYCLLKGGKNPTATGSSSGLIFFGTTTGTTGNDNNTIEYCTIRENTLFPICCIYSGGTATKNNSSNTISNCDFVNFRFSAIHIDANSDTWSILNNDFYQDQAISFANTTEIISINSGFGYTVTGNSIGGGAPNCGGSAFTRSITSLNAYFGAIFFGSGVSSGAINTINNNTIANLDITSTTLHHDIPVFSMIHTAGGGDFIVGASGVGNTIGSTSGTGNITITYNNTDAFFDWIFSPIYLGSTGSNTVEYNTIGSIDYAQVSVALLADVVSLITISTSGIAIVNENTIGNTIANNITITSLSMALMAISVDEATYTPVNVTITNNTIQNLTVNNDPSGTYTKLWAIWFNATDVPLSIEGNTLRNLTSNVSNPDANGGVYDAVVAGLYISTASAGSFLSNIYNNKISGLSSSYSGANLIYVVGIYLNHGSYGGLNVYRNKVRTLSNASSNSSSGVIGIRSEGSVATSNSLIYNNIIILADGSNTISKSLVGISSESSNSSETYIYHNTVKLEASYTSGSGISAALSMLRSDATFNVKNNIFQNLSTGGSGSHYAQKWTSTYGTPANIRNNYNETINSSKLVNWGGTDETIGNWRTAISDGSNTEVDGGISISSTTGAPSSSSIVGSAGTPIGSITVDYDLNSRSVTAPWIGAFELIIALPIELSDISAKCQKSKMNNSEYGATLQWTTATETNSDYFVIEGSKNGFDWQNLDTIDGSGTKYDPTNYYFHDDFINPTPENETVVYYRVSQTDFDGTIKTYDILSCKCEASDKIKIHPVPSTESIVINFGDQNNVPNSFQITDMFGKIIQDVTVIGDKANNTSYKLDISNYSSGRYIIKINDWKTKEDAIFIKK